LSSYLAARERINKKILTAITYPSFILVFFILAIAGITLFLVPRFKSMYSGFGVELPAITRMVFGFSDFVIAKIHFIVIGVSIVTVSLYFLIFRTVRGRYILDSLVLKIPIFGEVVRKAAISKFARTLATLLSQGIPINESIELVGRTSGNLVIEEASIKASKLIMNGENIPEALRKTNTFPPLLMQMSTVGVQSGNLPELLDKTADFYEDQVDTFTTVLLTLIEPILIVALGLIFAVVASAMYFPLFNLGDVVSQSVN
jgi:type IV pilus assembly protein PilC